VAGTVAEARKAEEAAQSLSVKTSASRFGFKALGLKP
jgi:hypothetical protein